MKDLLWTPEAERPVPNHASALSHAQMDAVRTALAGEVCDWLEDRGLATTSLGSMTKEQLNAVPGEGGRQPAAAGRPRGALRSPGTVQRWRLHLSSTGRALPSFQNGDIGLHFEVRGDGRPLVFLHGGTVNFRANYAAFGWPEKFMARGFQVVGLDFRGHGQSDGPHDPGAYGTANVAGDVTALLDHLRLDHVDLVAYSIGTAIALHLLQAIPARLGRVALVATGDGLIGLPPHEFSRVLPALAAVADRSAYPRDLPKHAATYWNFIESTGGDRAALKAFAEARYPPLSLDDARSITHPVLVVSGDSDRVLGRGPRLAGALGKARYLEVAGADHFSLAADATVQEAVADFLQAPNP